MRAAAQVVYTPVHIKLPVGGSYNLDLNNDGVPDITISIFSQFKYPCHQYSSLGELPASGNGVEGAPPAVLSSGAEIGPSQTFYGGSGQMAWALHNCRGFTSGGNWLGASGRYLGLSFQINGQTHYGWARLSVGLDGYVVAATLTGYAYETVPGTPIDAGQKK